MTEIQWWHFAACKDTPKSRFYSVGTYSSEVVRLCASCPVQKVCRDTAVEEDAANGYFNGYRGGTTGSERKKLAKRLKLGQDITPPPPAPPPVPATGRHLKHGTESGYSHYGCRCFDCIDAHRDRQRERRRSNKGSLAPDDPRHGTANAYAYWGCRCDRCRAAAVSKQMRWTGAWSKDRVAK